MCLSSRGRVCVPLPVHLGGPLGLPHPRNVMEIMLHAPSLPKKAIQSAWCSAGTSNLGALG